MPTPFASGKYAIAECDRCGQRYKLKQLKMEVIKTKLYQLKVCDACWDPECIQSLIHKLCISHGQTQRM